MRLFIAIDFPPEVKQTLFALSRALRRQADGGRAIPFDNFHLTLAFIGETERVRQVTEVMEDVCHAGSFEPLPLKFNGIGSFKGRGGRGGRGSRGSRGDHGDRGGHNWWVGIEPVHALECLAEALMRELRVAGFSIERRNFKPHITIGRDIVVSRPVELELPPVESVADDITLMRSELGGESPSYTPLARVQL
jgi:2'-5' RNA ligase